MAVTKGPQTQAFMLKEVHSCHYILGWENGAFFSLEKTLSYPPEITEYLRWSMC